MGKARKVLECVLCGERFTTKDVRISTFFPSTMVCASCYSLGVSKNNADWCFGDYRPKEFRECRTDCPDRVICKRFTLKGAQNGSQTSSRS